MNPVLSNRDFATEKQRRWWFAQQGGRNAVPDSASSYRFYPENPPTRPDPQSIIRPPDWKDRGRQVLSVLDRIGYVGEIEEGAPAWKAALGFAAALALPSPGGKARAASKAADAAGDAGRLFGKVFSHIDDASPTKAADAFQARLVRERKAANWRAAADRADARGDFTAARENRLAAVMEDPGIYSIPHTTIPISPLEAVKTTTPRKVLTWEYGSQELFEKAVQDARAYRAAHPDVKFLEDISDAALDLPVSWKHEPIEASSLAHYDAFHNLVSLAPDTSATSPTMPHEIRHALQREGLRKAHLSRESLKLPYLDQPWEQEVRAARLKSTLSRLAGDPVASGRQTLSLIKQFSDKPYLYGSQEVQALGYLSHALGNPAPTGPIKTLAERRALSKETLAKMGGLLSLPAVFALQQYSVDNRDRRLFSFLRNRDWASDRQRRWWYAQHGGEKNAELDPEGYTGPTVETAEADRLEAESIERRNFEQYLKDQETQLRADLASGKAPMIFGGPTTAAGNVLAAGGRAAKSLVYPLLTSVATGQAANWIQQYREDNATMDPRKDKALAWGEKLLRATSTLAGLVTAKRTLGKIPGAARLGQYLKTRIKAPIESGAEEYLWNPLPGVVQTPLKLLWKAYSGVANFTGSEIKVFGEIPKVLSKAKADLEFVPTLRSQAASLLFGKIPAEETTLRAFASSVNSRNAAIAALRGGPQTVSTAANIARMEAEIQRLTPGLHRADRTVKMLKANALDLQLQAKALESGASAAKKDLVARAAYVVGLVGGVAGTEYALKERAKGQMQEAWAHGEPMEYEEDFNPYADPLAAIALAAYGSLGNPLEKQSRDYMKGTFTSGPRNQAYQELWYDQIEAARKAGQITDAEARQEHLKRARERDHYNLAGGSVYSVTPALVGFANLVKGKVSDSIKYKDASILKDIYNPDQLAGVGLLAYGNTVGQYLPSALPVAWNAYLAGLGAYLGHAQGPKNKYRKTYREPQVGK